MGTVFFQGSFISIVPSSEYPPVALTSGTTAISGQSYGNGTYVASGSSYYLNNSLYLYFRAFDKDNGANFWHGNFGSYSASAPYAWTGGTSVTTTGVGNGEYVQLKLPSAVTVTSYQISTRSDFNLGYTYAPTAFALAGSNDGTTWTVVDSESGISWTVNSSRAFTVSTPSAYSYYRLVVFNCNGNSYTSIGEIRFFGN